MNLVLKNRLLDVGIAAVAVLVGAGIVYLGDKLLGVTLERFYGVETFTLFWVADLFLVPFIAGIVVSLIFGLGGGGRARGGPGGGRGGGGGGRRGSAAGAGGGGLL